MPSKHEAKSIGRREYRKEFRKQQRKLKKKSKKRAKEFGKLHRENKLKITTSKKSKKRLKPILKHSKNAKNQKKKPKKSVRFAEHSKLNKNKQKEEPKEEKEDVWIDERDEKWIKSLEKRMGFNRRDDDGKYWKHQEFTQDGLDCFFDLGYLSEDSNIDDEQKQSYQQYAQFKEYLDTKQTDDDKPNAQLKAYKQSKTSKKTKEQIYGQSVSHSDDDDIAMSTFLEESDDTTANGEGNTDEHKDKHTNHTTTVATNKYIPPQLRKLHMGQTNTNIQLKRCIGGHLNRLLSHNLKSISKDVNTFYADNKYSTSEITETLCSVIYNMIYKKEESKALNSIILCLSGLIVSIYGLHGIRIGSNMIEIFSNHIESNMNTVMMHNLLRFVSYLYLFQMLSAKYVIEMLILFVQTCDAECFHALKVAMMICGADLRNNDPIKFKDLIVLICNKSKELVSNDNATKNAIHIEDTMTIVFDIKDNKMSSRKNDTRNWRQFQELEASLGRVNRMPMGYKDFMNIAQHGRWWLSGAAVKGGIMAVQMKKRPQPIWKSEEAAYSFPDKLLEMSKRFHMNSPIRRAIFCIVMDSDDYIDAFQKLMQLNGEHTEILRIILLLCVRQNEYNKYYALLFGKIVTHRKNWKFSLHCALWDKFSEMDNGNMATRDIINMAKLLADLIDSHCLNLVVLKKLDIIKPEPKNMLFVSTLFSNLMNKSNVFAALSMNMKLRELKQDIQLFFSSVMMPRTKKEIMDLKSKHQASQQMVKQNTLRKDELIKLGLELRKKENFLILIKNAILSMHDNQVKTSSYNDLIV